MGRIFVSGKTVSIVPDEGERSITTNLKTLLNALKECKKLTTSVYDLKSLKIGEIEVSSKLHSYVYRAVKQKVTNNNHAANKRITGVKVYLPVSCTEWLDLKHGDRVLIENAVVDGEQVLIVRRAGD